MWDEKLFITRTAVAIVYSYNYPMQSYFNFRGVAIPKNQYFVGKALIVVL